MERIELKPGTDVLITDPSQGLKDAPATIKSVGAVYHAVTKQVEFSIVYDTGLKTHEIGYFKDLGLVVKPRDVVKLIDLKEWDLIELGEKRGIVVEACKDGAAIIWFNQLTAMRDRQYHYKDIKDAKVVGKVDLWKV
jgi:hypothetical protein